MNNHPRCLALYLAICWVLLASLSHAQEAPLTGVKEFADGQRPATAALQRLIDASDGLVELPSGTFLLDAPLRVDLAAHGYRSIRGADGATRLVVNCAGPALQIIGDHQGTAQPDSVQEHTWEKERFPGISGIEILGKHEQADGIELFCTMKCTIRNVLVRRCRYGIHLVERNRNVIIADSHVYDCSDTGIFLDNCNLHQVNILGSHISYNKRAGIRQSDGDVHNVQISGNDIEYNSGSAESSGEIVLEAAKGFISEYSITGNTIQAQPVNAGANIFVSGPTEDAPYPARTMTISGNIIGDRDKNIVLCRANRVTISGNTIYGGKTLSLHFQDCGRVVLDGNNVGTRPSTHGADRTYADGVQLENCTDCLLGDNVFGEHQYGTPEQGGTVTLLNTRYCRIANCHIMHPRFRGVHIVGGFGCVVSDNTIVGSDSKDFQAAIEVSGAGHGHLVQNNWIGSDHAEPIRIEGASGQSINNTVVSEREPETLQTTPEDPAAK